MPSGPINLRRSLQRMLSRKSAMVDLETFLAELIDVFGGPRLLALEYKKVYDQTAQSPMVRQKILMMIQQIVHATSVHNLSKPLDVSQLGDQELDEVLLMYMERMADAPSQAAAAIASASAGASAGSESGWGSAGRPGEDPGGDPAEAG